MRRLTRSARAAAAFALIAAVSCASATQAGRSRSGIEGTVLAGPTCPVETPESPCPDRPVEDARVTAKRRGTTRTTRTDASGGFRLRLAPGTYAVAATSDQVFGCDEQRARVEKDRFVQVTIVCDTGIR